MRRTRPRRTRRSTIRLHEACSQTEKRAAGLLDEEKLYSHWGRRVMRRSDVVCDGVDLIWCADVPLEGKGRGIPYQ